MVVLGFVLGGFIVDVVLRVVNLCSFSCSYLRSSLCSSDLVLHLVLDLVLESIGSIVVGVTRWVLGFAKVVLFLRATAETMHVVAEEVLSNG